MEIGTQGLQWPFVFSHNEYWSLTKYPAITSIDYFCRIRIAQALVREGCSGYCGYRAKSIRANRTSKHCPANIIVTEHQ